VLPANNEAAVESTSGLLRAEGPAAEGFGNLLAIAEHNAVLAADCGSPDGAVVISCAFKQVVPRASTTTMDSIQRFE
jgi:hypothetical protein